MNTRIEKDAFFQVGIHFRGEFYVNTYEVILSMLIETGTTREMTIAIERINHFLLFVLQHSVLISSEDTVSITQYKNAGLKVCELPEEPLDQLVGMVLIQKLNAIMENRLIITDITIGSTLSEGIRYNLVSEVAESVMSGDFWWNKPCLSISPETVSQTDADNVVKLFDDSDWAELGLTWKEKAAK